MMTCAPAFSSLLSPGAKLTIIPSKNSDRDAYVQAFKAALEEFLGDG